MTSLIDLTQQHISLSQDYLYSYENYEQLVDILNQHALAYYSTNNPVITDHEYDQLFDKLKQVEAKHAERISPDSPTQRVGAKADGRFENAQHTVPLLSLENSYDEHDLADRDESISKLLNKIGA
jgi:DNA ligase (NAD+)